jgi:hypothetical protein
MAVTVIEALRRFLPAFQQTAPPWSADQRRALWALTHCRTPVLGGKAYGCTRCGGVRFAWHSCNHKACPQCGRQATAQWIARELNKLLPAPYFLVTFTLPAQLRGEFFGPHAREAFDLFFQGVRRALAEKLATDKDLQAAIHGFTAVLHTWQGGALTQCASRAALWDAGTACCPVSGWMLAADWCKSRTPRGWSTCRICGPPSGNTVIGCSRRSSGRWTRRCGRWTGACTFDRPGPGRRP